MMERARALVAQATGLQPDSVADTASSTSLDAWDSLAHMRLVLALEEQLGRTLTGEEIFALHSVAAVHELLG